MTSAIAFGRKGVARRDAGDRWAVETVRLKDAQEVV